MPSQIREKVVFVLGAGASKPYGLPLGRKLLSMACKELVSEESPLPKQLHGYGHSRREVEEFTSLLRYSALPSIDAVVAKHPKFSTLGRTVIAACLLPLDVDERLFPPNERSDSWYPRLIPDLIDASTDRSLSVITFNYDCTLERFLRKVIDHRLEPDLRPAARKRCQSRIVHVHGWLQDPWSGGVGPPAPRDVQDAAESLTILSEADVDSPDFARARALLSEATSVYFLGFGFHPDNTRRLGLHSDNRTLEVSNKRWFATAYDMHQNERGSLLGAAFGVVPKFICEPYDVYGFLRLYYD